MMFALRRAVNPLRTRLHCLTAATNSHILLHQISPTQSNNLNHTQPNHRNLFTFHGFSSKSGIANSKGEEQLQQEEEEVKHGFSELDDPPTTSEEEQEHTFAKADEEDPKKEVKTVSFDLFTVIASAPSVNVYAALDNFIEEVRALENVEISKVLHKLSRRKMYERAYQFSNWLESKKMLNFEEEKDYATRLDLIAKVRGIALAEKYMKESIPENFKGDRVYGIMLSNYALVGNVKKAEQVFDKMRDLGFLVNASAYQQMINLYKRFDRKKIASVLSLMEENGVKPTPSIYELWIDVKGKANDIPGMEKLVEDMQSDGLELDNYIRPVLARHYITAGFHEKAGELLKEIEGEDLEEHPGVCKVLLALYAALGKADEVERIWKVCESNGHADDYLAAISAFGKLGRVEKAEEVFEKRIASGEKISSKGYAALLNVYVDHKLLAKGKDLAKRMASANLSIDWIVLDSLVKLYVDAGEVEKADLVLCKAMQQPGKGMRPSHKSLQLIMNQYSKRGDVNNTEKIFQCLKQSGYVNKIWDYQSLLQAYIKAKAPAYGFRERMKADNVTPNKFVAGLLAQANPFKKAPLAQADPTKKAPLSNVLD